MQGNQGPGWACHRALPAGAAGLQQRHVCGGQQHASQQLCHVHGDVGGCGRAEGQGPASRRRSSGVCRLGVARCRSFSYAWHDSVAFLNPKPYTLNPLPVDLLAYLAFLRSLTCLEITDRSSRYEVLGEVLLINGLNNVESRPEELGSDP